MDGGTSEKIINRLTCINSLLLLLLSCSFVYLFDTDNALSVALYRDSFAWLFVAYVLLAISSKHSLLISITGYRVKIWLPVLDY